VRKALLALLVLLSLALLPSCREPRGSTPPKLVVLVGVDQLRADYLRRYDSALSGGFRRLKDEGRYWERAIVDHAPTLSYPGHATLATGAYPRTHGFTANDWIETDASGVKRRVLVAADPTTHSVGHPDEPSVSPRSLRVTGLADWIRAADPDARAVALSTGPALAMIYGGRALPDERRNHAYWLARSEVAFETSSYFRSSYPGWVATFNSEQMPRFAESRVWETTVPEADRHLARRDAAPYEGDGEHTTFPHAFEGDEDAYSRWFFDSPFADEALFALAATAVRAEKLGQRGATDLLTLAVKSVDRIGHDYGPRSQEQLDVLVRLDRLLGSFLQLLDETVGPDRYVVALSADHGAPNVVEFEIEEGRPGRRVREEEVQALLDDVERLVETHPGPREVVAERIARELERADFVAKAMTPTELAGGGESDGVLRAYRHSYIPGRDTSFPLWTREVLYGRVGDAHPVNWGVVVALAEGAQLWTAPSTHGGPWAYDREVPLVFMGAGVARGRGTGPARTVDVAPTLAGRAGVEVPDTVDGHALPLGGPK
jgi:hypothetical protein